jgi:hypothetical protein
MFAKLLAGMMGKSGKLSAVQVARARPGYYGDGAGLWLQVRDTGTKAWVYRYAINGRARYGPRPSRLGVISGGP